MEIPGLNAESLEDPHPQSTMTLPMTTLCSSNNDDILPAPPQQQTQQQQTQHCFGGSGTMADAMDTFCLNISKSEHSFSPVLSSSTTNAVTTLTVNASKDIQEAQFVPINHASTVNDAEESSIERSSDRDDEPVECGECNKDFQTLQEYMEHPCARSESGSRVGRDENQGSVSDNELSDGESFDGKIVYNPDGSAYIIEGADSDQSDIDSIVDVPQQEGSIVVKKGKPDDTKASIYPQIANAFFVPRNPTSFFNNFYMVAAQKYTPEAPIMHSYRVYDVRSAKKDLLNESKNGEDADESNEKSAIRSEDSISTSNAGAATVPTKPILMCFICKLSFGYTKSFIAHAIGEHSMDLNEEEKAIMSRKNASAIIQGVGKNKKPLMSFLEPNPTQISDTTVSPNPRHLTNSHPTPSVGAPSTEKDSTSVSYSHGRPNTSEKLTSSKHFHSQNCSVSSQDFTTHISNSVTANSASEPGLTHAVVTAAATAASMSSAGSSTQMQVTSSSGSQLSSAAADTATVATTAAAPSSGSITLNVANSGDLKPSLSTHLEFERVSVSEAHTPSYSEHNHIERTNSNSFLTSHVQGIASFLGSCDEHPQGRAHGVECPKCDMVLSSSQSLGGHMTMMHSRNSCKTLKCPKCNWHYKYQETLEIHMKEKHPDNETQCIYCVTNQPHPRLARGETYACGYKPYRCEVCNYSTTTKGNLSIHMQSDKHLNNVQELANGGDIKLQTQTFTQESAQLKKNKPKPTWRCDVCNYETNVARNLRIHMTSEKHTHNMLALQQNMKQMQGDMGLHMNPVLLLGQQDPNLLNLQSSLTAPNSQFTFDPSLLQQGSNLNFEAPVDLSKENDLSCFPFENDEKLSEGAMMLHCCVCNIFTSDSIDTLSHHLNIDRTKQHETDDIIISAGMYMCNLCTYKTNLKTNFYLHLKTDKHLQRLQLVNHIKEGGANNEWRLKYLTVNNPVLVRCNACEFCTNSIHKLQMHANTEAHDACAQLFHHMANIETKVPSDRREFVCTLCNFSARSKCQMFHHARCMKHAQNDSMRQLQLQEQGKSHELDLSEIFIVREYTEELGSKMSESDGETEGDDENAPHQAENAHHESEVTSHATSSAPSSSSSLVSSSCLLTTNADSDPTGNGENQEQALMCPYCNYTSISEMRIQSHVLAQHPNQKSSIQTPSSTSVPPAHHPPPSGPPLEARCPLCQDDFREKAPLEKHLIQVHNVSPEGMHRLLTMVDQEWLNNKSGGNSSNSTSANNTASKSQTSASNLSSLEDSKDIDMFDAEEACLNDDAIDTATLSEKELEDQFRCQTCTQTFNNIDALYAHQNDLGHLELKQTPRGPGYLCWKKGCNQYFKTGHSLQVHFREIHTKRQQISISERHVYKYRCNQCSLAFKTIEKLQQHSHYHLIREATRCSICGRSFRSTLALQKHIEITHHSDGTDSSAVEAELMNAGWSSTPLIGPKSEKLTSDLASPHPNSTGMNISAACKSPSVECKASTSGSLLTNTLIKTEPLEHSEGEKLMATFESSADSSSSIMNGDSKLDSSDNLLLDESAPGEADEGSLDSVSSSYKEQQFMEDYINSQAIAEGNYDDPQRKFKCHRCKVAFTKQSYLTAHNKTLQHRKGDKLSYPMEKYLDPNRPYKCDVCKESFTQKNILLVHYNSVSHLHKLKQTQQLCSLPLPILPPSSTPTMSSTPCSTSTTSSASMVGAAASSSPSSLVNNDSEKKPYRCNLCKVAYSQGSTLDIHIRSVLHQARASKLPEFAMSGQLDLSLPLIEQPEVPKSQNPTPPFPSLPHQQTPVIHPGPQQLPIQIPSPHAKQTPFPDILHKKPLALATLNNSLPQHPPPLLFSHLGNPLPVIPNMLPVSSLSTMTSSTPQPEFSIASSASDALTTSTVSSSGQPAAVFSVADFGINASHDDMPMKLLENNHSMNCEPPTVSHLNIGIHACSNCNSVFSNHETLLQHQQNFGCLQSGTTSPVPQSSQNFFRSRNYIARLKQHVHRNLLENIGFECVMQFNEFNQRSAVKKENSAENSKKTEEEEEKEKEETSSSIQQPQVQSEKETPPLPDKPQIEMSKTDLPEINKSVCNFCSKEFSSVWVLKAHQEEIHRIMVPIEAVEEFGSKFRSSYEKKQPKDPEPQMTPAAAQPIPPPLPPPPPPIHSHIPPTSHGSSSQCAPMSIPTSLPSSSSSSQVSEKVLTGQDMNLPQNPLDFTQMMPVFNMMHMPVPMNMNLAMGMHPPLMPMMMPPGLDGGFMPPMTMIDPNFLAAQQQAQHAQNQKRARTRINDEQLKILRANFDINNSPSEEQIVQMSEQSGLPQKVIKHWFRNTLFKERQRNKDSPYNFSNPPQTTINLEEYEKTGRIPSPSEQDLETEYKEELKSRYDDQLDDCDLQNRIDQVSEADFPCTVTSVPMTFPPTMPIPSPLINHHIPQTIANHITSTPVGPRHIPMDFQEKNDYFGNNSNSSGSNNSQGGSGKRANRTRFTDYQIKVLQEYFEQNAYPKDDDLDHLSKLLNLSPRVIVVWFQNARQKARKIYENQSPADLKDDGSGSFSRSGPNYQYQCKKCHSIFPRYYDLMKHQKRQNCQEGDKTGMSNTTIDEDSNSTVTSHEETTHSESSEIHTAELPKPISTIANSNCNPLKEVTATSTIMAIVPSGVATTTSAPIAISTSTSSSAVLSTPPTPTQISLAAMNSSLPTSLTSGSAGSSKTEIHKCEKCNLMFPKFEQWQEHQKVHSLNPNLFANFPSDNAFGLLQNIAPTPPQQQQQQQPPQPPPPHLQNMLHDKLLSPIKRKAEEEEEERDQPRDKRLRTTILPEQLDYLYQKYQIDCNPSRKQLETIASEVGLKKRVVQVWFQNTRARERKGQYRAHQQLIHKRCPFCRALFRAKSALESHLATKHPEEMAKGEINIDNIPDATVDSTPPPPPPPQPQQVSQAPSSSSLTGNPDLSKLLSPTNMQPFLPFMPQGNMGMGFTGLSDPLQTSMRQFCEASFKKFISELSAASHGQRPQQPSVEPPQNKAAASEPEKKPSRVIESKNSEDNDAPLDLSKPIRVNTDCEKTLSDGPSTDVSERSMDGYLRRHSLDDSISETHSESHEIEGYEDSSGMMEHSPSSPANATSSSSSSSHPHGKRYRTQMSSMQVRVMKTLFADYKTPTMAECEMLGREIGLPKRVVQVWFQNARAKEKKNKLAYSKTFGTDVDFSKPPEECTLCNFKYSHKYTVQDHIFTKKHIDNVRQFIQSQSNAERELADPSGMTKMLQQQREIERMRKAWDEASVASSPHLAQLQAMRLNALGLQGTSSAFNTPFNASSFFPDVKKEALKAEGEKKEKEETQSRRDAAANFLSPQMMSPFTGLGFEPSLIPNLYTGFPNFFSGVNLPLFQFGLMPGMEQLLAYDPVTFGTPLSLLQIPEQARRHVSAKLLETSSNVAQYTQDCKTLADLKSALSDTDFKCVQESTVDVGYICKKCHIVYPGKDGCENHQHLICFPGGKVSDGIKPILKLEQVQYECVVCQEKFSTSQEFILHCSLELHKNKSARHLAKSDWRLATSLTPAPSENSAKEPKLPSVSTSTALTKKQSPGSDKIPLPSSDSMVSATTTTTTTTTAAAVAAAAPSAGLSLVDQAERPSEPKKTKLE